MAKKGHRKRKKSPKPGLEGLPLLSYTITYDPIEDEHIARLPVEVQKQIENLYELTLTDPKNAILELKELKSKYPDVPQLYNYLTAAYSLTGKNREAEEMSLENYRRHPDYLFAKVNYATFCLSNGELEKIEEIFENKYDLKMIYPDRDVFHVTEYVGFASVIGRYFCRLGKLQQAKLYLKTLKQVVPDDKLTEVLEKELFYSQMTTAMETLLKKIKKR